MIKLQFAPKRTEVSWRKWFQALVATVFSNDRQGHIKRIQAICSADSELVICWSVRSAFDLLLEAMQWGEEDEILFSGVTIADMPKLAELRGIRVKAFDIDPKTGEPDISHLKRLVSSRTKAVVVVHLFGTRYDLSSLISFTSKQGIVLVEDCAQAYNGPGWKGHEGADLSLFSFGPVKTATALGGSLAYIRNVKIREEMTRIHESYPVQRRSEYITRLLKFIPMSIGSQPLVFTVINLVLRGLSIDTERLIHSSSSNRKLKESVTQLRRRPTTGLLKLLTLQLEEGVEPLVKRRHLADTFLDELSHTDLVPTASIEAHNYWIMPLVLDGTSLTKRDFRDAGIFVISTRMVKLDGLSDDSGAARIANAIMLPFDPYMKPDELRILAGKVNQLFHRQNLTTSLTGQSV